MKGQVASKVPGLSAYKGFIFNPVIGKEGAHAYLKTISKKKEKTR
jgi:hypothetical protein